MDQTASRTRGCSTCSPPSGGPHGIGCWVIGSWGDREKDGRDVLSPYPRERSEQSPCHHERSEYSPRPQGALTLSSILRPDQLADLLFDLVHLGEAIQGVLGEDLSPVEKDFERSRPTGGNRHRPELFV